MTTLSAFPASSSMSAPRVRVLVVDDDATLRRSLARVLESRGHEVLSADGGPAALEIVARTPVDVALVDFKMPTMDGLEVLDRIKKTRADVEVIIMTAFADLEMAITAVKAGAYHFLTKPFLSNDAVALSVSKAAEHHRLTSRARRLEERLEAHERFGELIGTSKGMLEVYRLIQGVSTTTSTILILGESGTGKELVARAIHANSPRAHGPLVAVNCAAIPKELVESELFGHVRGAFTGAQNARAGLFESANGGTLMLDEVGDLPQAAQVSLLRALQSGEIKRVGSDETRQVDVRVLAATNVDLPEKIASGAFRRDLFYRLNVIAIRLPPLRERGDDILLLADHFLHKLARRLDRPAKQLGADAAEELLGHTWPGNVRELEHALEHAFVLSRGDVIVAGDLPFIRERAAPPPAVAPRAPSGALPDNGCPGSSAFPASLLEMPYAEAKRAALAMFDETYVQEAMRRASGNLSEAARQAGLDRSNFRRLAKKPR